MLGALVALVARTRAGAAAALLAVTAVLVRWGSPSLSALGGDQAVLGPAVLVGSTGEALGSLLAALAVALLAPSARPQAVALGVVAGAIGAGPALPHDAIVRVLGIAAGVGVALLAPRVPGRRIAAVGAGALALVLASLA